MPDHIARLYDLLLSEIINPLPNQIRKLYYLILAKIFRTTPDYIERIVAESVDPKAPLSSPDGEEKGEQPKRSFEERIKALPGEWRKIVHEFLVPQPVMVPAQLETPEINFNDQAPEPLKGQRIYAIIAIFCVVSVTWAACAQIDEVVRAEGEVVPSDNVQVVQTRLPGSIVAINVSLGDTVQKGDVLFRIEDEDVVANFDDNEINRLSALAAVVRLEAERDELDEVVFPDDLVAIAPGIVEQEVSLFNSRRLAKQGEIDVLIQESESLEQTILEREAESRLATGQIETTQEEFDILEPLVDKGFEPKLKLIDVKTRLQEAQGRKELADLGVGRLKSDLEAQKKKLESLENRFRTDVETQLVEMRTAAAQGEVRLDALKGKVEYAEVRAPVDGEISAVHAKTIGGVVEAGAVLAELVPFEEQVTVRARLMPDDVSKINIGQTVRISLSSFDVSRYGSLEGVVDQIASNSTQEQNQPPYFVTMVKIADPKFANSDVKPEITPGMTAVVDVLGDKRTVLSYILSPIQRAQTIAFKEK
jgi:HlyD family type I secretion membrane fusion protein